LNEWIHDGIVQRALGFVDEMIAAASQNNRCSRCLFNFATTKKINNIINTSNILITLGQSVKKLYRSPPICFSSNNPQVPNNPFASAY
jgi:hypothetical protein